MKPLRYTKEMEDRYTKAGHWGNPTVMELWDQHAKGYPDKEAIVDSRTRMTFAQTKEWTDRVALGLLELGLKKDNVVLCQTPNMVESFLFRFSLEKAGIIGSQAPTFLRHREIELILNLVEAVGIAIIPAFNGFDYYKMIQEIRPNVPQLKHIFVFDEPAPEGTTALNSLSRQPIEKKYPDNHLLKTKISPYEVLMLAMTSGTTGLPKVVEATANNMWSMGVSEAERMKVTSDDIFGAFAPIIGGPSAVPCWITAPHRACKLVLMEKFDPDEALKIIEKEKITIAGGVPAMMAMMVKSPNIDKYDLSSLRIFFYAGAVLPYNLAEEVEEKMGCVIQSALGTIDSNTLCCNSVDDPVDVRRISVGKAYPGNEIRLVDENGQDVPQDEIGEIIWRGAMSFAGYHNDPEATLAAYGGEMDGWFHTGDLGKFDADGNLYVVGRSKDVIIRGGQNVFPIEIENLLVTHPKVIDVSIVAMPDPTMGEKACAYVIPKAGETFAFDEMTFFLKEKKIAPYKLPERLEIVDRFPMSGDGQKIKKNELTERITQKLKEEGKIT